MMYLNELTEMVIMMREFNTKILTFLIALLVFVSSLPITAFADTTNSEKHVRVGYFTMENFMEGGTDGSNQSGFTYELLCEIAAYNHWNIEYVYGDFSDLYKQLVNGEIDILPNTISSEERKQQVMFDDFSINDEHYYISTLDNGISANMITPDDLNGKRIATVKDALEEKFFDEWALENNVEMDKVYFKGFDEAWNSVIDGKTDYILNINNTAPQEDFITLFEVGKNDVYFAIAKNREDVLQDIDYAIDMIGDISPFLIANLRQKYLNDSLFSRMLSSEEKAWVESHDVLRIGGLKNDVPYTYEDEDGEVVGAYVELTKSILENCSVDSLKIEWKLYGSIDEMRAALKNGELEMIIPEYHSYNEANSNGFAISETVMNIPMGLLTLASSKLGEVDTIATGGTRPGLIYAKENFQDSQIVSYDSVDELVKAVRKGEVEAATAHIYALQDSIHGENARYTITPLSEPCIICFAAMEENHELIMIMNRGYHLISQDERNSMELRNASGKVQADVVKEFFRENLLIIVLGLLFLLAIVAYLIRSIFSKKLKKEYEKIKLQNEIIEASREELEVANELAQAANKAKTAFLFNMSHDLRTPMNAIIGFNNIAISHIDDKDVVRNSLNKINTGSKQLLSLINDVLDMARIESGKINCECEPVDIKESAGTLMDIIRESMQKSLNILVDFSGVEHNYVLADWLHIDRILTNIIGNSIKYTPEGGTVKFLINEVFNIRDNYYSYDYIVEDNGIGMSEEFLEHIYEEFSRERNSTVSGVQGTGLGMAITKKLVDIIGGTIDIQSKVGEGTKVTVHLELEATDPDLITEKSQQESIDNLELSGKKVLLVEDNELNREIAIDILSDQGMIVDTAEDGDIAVEKMKNASFDQYDLILMDVQMPRMNGYEATMEIRKLPDDRIASIPIIAMTANAFEEDKKNAFNAGMNGHISKPIDMVKLFHTLTDILK